MIDPIDEFGVFSEGFGWQTGRFAGATTTRRRIIARDVADDLEREGPARAAASSTRHRYPVCWRCGTQLVFRLVDEWFIAMDPLREPSSSDVDARRSTWLPPGIGLRGARARLAPEHGRLDDLQEALLGPGAADLGAPTATRFEVIGSREELRERAVEGWEEFDGHTPHRPWIDKVKIACATCGEPIARIPTWATRGSTPASWRFSTMSWNTDRDYWAEWYPADFITETFPGQFRNWFYALLADEHDDDRPRRRSRRCSATRSCATSTARRCTRARATRSSSTTRPSRSAPTSCAGCSAPPTRRRT